jgi:glutamine synthetase
MTDRLSPVPAELEAELTDAGIAGVAITFVDNSGVARVKGIPTSRITDAASRGVGTPPVIDAFLLDDRIAPVGSPVGDLRLVPDLSRLVPLAAQPGWAWAPADRVEVDGSPYAGCQRSFARRMTEEAAAAGFEVQMAWETEFVLDGGHDDEIVPVTEGSAYGLSRLIDLSSYGRDLLEALSSQGVEVEQLHPEYAPSQVELSVGPQDPVGAADRVTLVRATIRAVAVNHGFRVSLSPAMVPGGVGSGAHLHLSVWRDGVNLLAPGHGDGTGADLDPVGEAWLAGLLEALPALLAVGAPSVASYLRLQPQRWAAPWKCWGRENREAALRLVVGSAAGEGAGSNVEIKVFDASSNPYLAAGAVVAAGLDGVKRGLRLPAEATVDPATLDAGELEAAGITRLPSSLSDALAAWEADDVVRSAMGPALAATWSSVRRAEIDRFAGSSDDEVAQVSRWVW